MKLVLERHNYAPELSRAHIVHRGRVVAVLPAPGCRTIKEARRALFGRVRFARYAVIQTTYANGWSPRVRRGTGSLSDVGAALRLERAWHNSPDTGHVTTARTMLAAVPA